MTAEVAEAVFRRDTIRWWLKHGTDTHSLEFWLTFRVKSCVAAYLDLAELARCSGRITLDHVNDTPTFGRRAPDDEQHLVSLCEFHHLGYKAGRNWATSHRPELRQYLKECYET